ncbi:MAG: alanine racemase [Pseudomonadota bacterium]
MSLRPRATIHLSNIVDNWRRLNAHSGPGGAGAVVKADAYGHGVGPVSKALSNAGCQAFFVAYGFEGAQVRHAVGEGPDIFVFNGLGAISAEEIKESDLIPVLNSLADISDWVGLRSEAPFALHIDTGMNRLGVRTEAIDRAVELLGDHAPVLLMTHYACADDPASPASRQQMTAFKAAAATFPGVPLSVSNSAAQWLHADMRLGLSRPGIALYGGGNSPARPQDLLPGMSLEAPILQVQKLPRGEAVGYGACYKTDQPAVIATVALGYGDGFLRSLSNCGFGFLGDIRCPIVGRVSMDLTTIDVTAAYPLAKPGRWVEFIGSQADLELQANAAGTLGYELITGLGPRVERFYEY